MIYKINKILVNLNVLMNRKINKIKVQKIKVQKIKVKKIKVQKIYYQINNNNKINKLLRKKMIY